MSRGSKGEPTKLTEEIAKTIRGELARQQMTKTELAKTVGISLPQISKLTAGLKRFDIEDLDAICEALGLNLREVVADAEAASESRHLV